MSSISYVAVSKTAVNRQELKMKAIKKLNCEVRRHVTTLTARNDECVFWNMFFENVNCFSLLI